MKALDNRFYVKFMQLEIGLFDICLSLFVKVAYIYLLYTELLKQ